MAHLKCAHERRVIVITTTENTPVVRHRSDGGECDSRFVIIDTVVYDPRAQQPGPWNNALGPMVTIGKIDDAIARDVKKSQRRQVKKVKR